LNYFIKKNIKILQHYFIKYNFNIIISLYLFLTISASLLFSFNFSLLFPDIVNNNYIKLENIPFRIGDLINNILQNHSYKVQLYEIDIYLDRLPFVAFITIIISNISSNIYFFLIIKNIIFFSLFLYTCYKIKYVFHNNPYLFFALTHIFFLNFYNLQTSLNFVFEDAYLSILLPCLFLILINDKIKYREILASIFLILLFFTKTTMIYLTLAIGILIVVAQKNKSIKKYLPILSVLICMIIWGLFGYGKTNRIPFLNSVSSTNQEGLALVFNEKFNYIYPENSIDILYPEVINKNLPVFKSEWEYYDYFESRNKKYLAENKLEIIKGITKKLNFLFFNIKDKNKYSISHILNRIFFFLSLLFFFYKFIKKKLITEDIYFIVIITTNLLPHVIGWITSKHLVPIFVICHIYCLLNINKIIHEKYKTN
jgi:hypothetical protein